MATIQGTAAAEVLSSGAASDRLNGLGGDDTLKGGGGNDTLDGGTGNDRLSGGAGNDLYIVDSANDRITETATQGTDTVHAFVSYTLEAHVENLTLRGSININGTGNAENNKIIGNGGDNELSDRRGADTLIGGGGADTLNGGAGADLLAGGGGNDFLIWHAGDVSVAGGVGIDTLLVFGALNLTTVSDRKIVGIEVIDLAGSLTLSATDVLAISNSTDTLRVDGGAGSVVNAGAGWTHIGNITIGSEQYVQWTKDGATLQVDTDIGWGKSLLMLDGTNGFRLDGIDAQDRSGHSVASAGDVNGDGFADLIIGAWGADAGTGESYVVFGKDSGLASSIDLAALDGANGFRLDGIDAFDRSGHSVASAGDVNGDGFDDLVIGAYRADPGGIASAGESYVVFGKASGFASSIDLAALDGANGFRLDGIDALDRSGHSVASAGDVNGDGFDDLIIGAYRADPGGHQRAGESYVVFGKAAGFAASIDLAALDGASGFVLNGIDPSDWSGHSVASTGDVNGDGFDDLIIGAYRADPGDIASAGESYVVFGKASGFAASIDLAALDGANGFRLDGIDAGDLSGYSVASAGDVNGDGFGDIIIGARGGDSFAGESYVVFGKASGFASSMNLSTLNGANGFRLDGIDSVDQSGFSVAAAGDVNGDGFDDLIIGAIGAGDSYAGESYVVFGKASGFGSGLDLASLNGTNGFRLEGIHEYDLSGFSVAAAGDVNGDGFDDLIIGARDANAGGESYVVFGGDSTGAVTFLGTGRADTLTGTSAAETFVSGQGNDTLDGGGGADVFNAGAGDDWIGVSSTGFRDVDGGSGADTLALEESGLALDLTALANNKITGIEVIDLAGSGNNTLTLLTADVLDLSDTTNALRVDGDSGDAVISTGQGWVASGTVQVFPGIFYSRFIDGAAILLLDPDIVATSTIN